MEIKEKKVITEWELKSDVFNFNQETRVFLLNREFQCGWFGEPIKVFTLAVNSKDFGEVEITLKPKTTIELDNVEKLVKMILQSEVQRGF